MTQLALGLLLFLAVHSLRIIAPLWRYRQITRWGQTRFRLVYGLLSLLTLWWAVQGYAQARGISPELWQAPHGLRHFSVALMWPAMVLLAAWAIPGNGIKAKTFPPHSGRSVNDTCKDQGFSPQNLALHRGRRAEHKGRDSDAI